MSQVSPLDTTASQQEPQIGTPIAPITGANRGMGKQVAKELVPRRSSRSRTTQSPTNPEI